MAIDTLATQDKIQGGGRVADSASALQQTAYFGRGVLPPVNYSYGYGTSGAFQVSKWWLGQRTLAATTYDLINLTSGLATFGVTQAFAVLKRVFVGIVSPDGAKALRVGPDGQTHANPLWFSGAGSGIYEKTYSYVLKDWPQTGWAVSAGSTDVLAVYNPGATPVTYALWLLGN